MALKPSLTIHISAVVLRSNIGELYGIHYSSWPVKMEIYFFSLPCFIKWTLVWNILCFIHSSFWAITKCALLYYFLFTEETVINTRSEAQARFWKCTIDVLCGPFVFWVTRHHAGDLWVHLIAIIWFIPHWRPYYSWQRLRNSIWYSI